MLADVLLIPKAIGLVVIDSFNHQVPIITTDSPGHGPEFDYLIDGTNSLISINDSIELYSNLIISLANNSQLLMKLKNGCLHSSNIYTIENMVENFISGLDKIEKLK